MPYGLKKKNDFEEALRAGISPYADIVPENVVRAVFEMESSGGTNAANEKYDLGNYGWLTGLTKTGHAAQSIKNVNSGMTAADKYKFTKVKGWNDISTPEAAFAHTASALAIAKRDNPDMSWEDIYFKKYNANPAVDSTTRRMQFRSFAGDIPGSNLAQNTKDVRQVAASGQSLEQQSSSVPFAATKTGQALNTVKYFPGELAKTTVKTAKDIGQGILRNMLSAVISVGKKFGGAEEVSSDNLKPKETSVKDLFGQELFSRVFGSEPVQSVEDRVANWELKIKNTNFAKNSGIDQTDLPLGLAMFGVIGSTAMDLTPFSGSDDLAKQLLKETDPTKIAKILAKIKAPAELIPKFAEDFAKADSPKLIEEGLASLQSLMGVKRLADLEKAGPDLVDDLATEARKFKSADEFVKAQGEPVTLYHGSNKSLTKDGLDYGTFLTANKQEAIDYANMRSGGRGGKPVISEFTFSPDEVRLNSGTGEYQYIGKTKNLTGGKYPEAIYKALNDVEGSNLTRKEIDAIPLDELRARASMGLESGKEEFNQLVRPTKSQLTDIKISEADRLIADGKLRVVSRDGRDVYQYKKGGEWVNARDESSAVDIVTRPPKSKAVSLPEDLEMRRLDIEQRKQALEVDPAKELGKYALGRGEFAGQLPEATGTGASRFSRKGDDIVTELGFKDSEEARVAYDNYKARKLKVDEDAKLLREEERVYRVEQKLKKVDPAVKLSRSEAPIASKLSSPEMPLLTGEARSLEIAAQKALSKANLVEEAKEGASLNKIILNRQTPVQKKVHIFDYLRTPELVLEKIGLKDEAILLRAKYDDYLKELPQNIDKITNWIKQVPAESNQRIFRYLDGEAIDLTAKEAKVVSEIKDWLKTWADRLKLPEDKRISNYITHLFDDQFIKKEFDEDLAKLIVDKVPGSVYDPFLQERLGAKGYLQDTWKALDAYVKRATRKVHMDVALNKLEEASEGLELSQWNYVKRLADRVNLRPTELENLADNLLKTVIGYRAGQRPTARITGTMRRMFYRGALGLNIGSAVKNLTQGVNTFAELGTKYTVIGYSRLLSGGIVSKELEPILRNDFVQDRVLSASKKFWQKTDKGLYALFEAAERINRGAAYFGAKSKALRQGKTELEAIEFAKRVVRKTQFAYGSIDTPIALQSSIAKTLTQFQSFSFKQAEFLIDKAKAKEYAGLVRYVGASLVVFGTIGKMFGMKPSDLIPSFRMGIPPSLGLPKETAQLVLGSEDKYGNKEDFGKRFKNVISEALKLIPASSQIKKTIQGIDTVNKGASVTASGKKQYKVGKSRGNMIRGALFGKYNLPEAQKFYNKKSAPKKTNRYGL